MNTDATDNVHFQMIIFAFSQAIKDDCYRAYICHPKVNVNDVAQSDGSNALSVGLRQLSVLYGNGDAEDDGEYISTESHVRRIVWLLEAGINLRANVMSTPLTCIQYAKAQLDALPENSHWRLIVAKMDEVINA